MLRIGCIFRKFSDVSDVSYDFIGLLTTHFSDVIDLTLTQTLTLTLTLTITITLTLTLALTLTSDPNSNTNPYPYADPYPTLT